MTTAKLYPAPGRFARDPVTGMPLDAAGETKPLDGFWRRRIAAGDVFRRRELDAQAPAEIEPAEPEDPPPVVVVSVADVLGPDGTPSGQSDGDARVEPQAKPARKRARRTEH